MRTRRRVADAARARAGIEAVCQRRLAAFELEYRCEGPVEPAWFLMSVTPFRHAQGGAVVSHRNMNAWIPDKIVARERKTPWRPAWIARETRELWISNEAPLLEPIGPTDPAHGIVSLVLADIARCFQAGATGAEILARYGARSEEPSAELVSLAAKLETQGAWEAEHYMQAMAT